MRLDRLTPHCLFVCLMAVFVLGGPLTAHAQSIKDLFERAAQSFYDGRYEQAINDYEKIIELEPNFAPAYNALGLALKVQGAGTEEAAYYFKKAIELDPKFVSSYDNLGKLYYSEGDMDQAESYFTKGLEIDPANESMLLSMGWVNLLGRGSADKAMKYFRTVTKNNESAMGYFGQGICLMANEKRMEVMDIVTKLRSINQENLALDLETMMRENRTLIKGPQMPQPNALQTAPRNAGNPNANPSNAPARPSSSQTGAWPGEYSEDGEFQVRLRGKLDEQ
jgi:tetratricopeptide (TPR) repeat protein